MDHTEFSIGNRYSRDDIENITGKGFANVPSGICRRRDDKDNLYGLIFATEVGDYDNMISDSGTFKYRGSGKDSQKFKDNYSQCRNCFLRDSISNDYPLHFFYRKYKNDKYEYRGLVKCIDYQVKNSDTGQRIIFKMKYEEYPEGLPSPSPNRLDEFRREHINDINPNMSEEELRKEIIDDFVYNVLEWNDQKNITTYEEQVFKIDGKRFRSDYSLQKEGDIKCIVEVKKPKIDISNDQKEQLSRYMDKTGCPFGLLTNGRRWEIMTRSENKETIKQTSISDTKIRNIREEDMFTLLHISTLSDKASEELALEIGQYKKTIDTLKNNKKVYVNELIDNVPNKAENKAESLFEESIDELICELEDEMPVIGRPEMH